MRKQHRDSHQFKPLLVEIEERPLSPLGRSTFWIVIMILGFLLLYLTIGKVDVVVSARGKIIPDGEIKTVKPLTSGIVREIFVKKGDFVDKGEPLVEIDPSNVKPELESMKKNLMQLELEISRLRAQRDNQQFTPNQSGYDTTMVRLQQEIYFSLVERIKKQVDIKNNQLKENSNMIASVAEELDHKRFLLDKSGMRLVRLDKVKNIISKDDFNRAESDLKSAELAVKTLEYRLDQLKLERKRIVKESDLIIENERERVLLELAEKKQEYVTLKAEIKRAAFINARQQITAPVSGYVSNLFIHTPGGVVTVAEELLQLVPVNYPLIVKAVVLNKDIGFIAEGMDAMIKIDTFNFQKYGLIKGTVTHIAKDSVDYHDLGPVYEVNVLPKETSIMVEGRKVPITAGMTVTAEINVGKRRIIEFFIYPIIKYLDEGMSVR